MSYVILADDFSGAHDAGAAFIARGFRTSVITDPRRLENATAEVIILDTNSRDCSPSVARKRLIAACRAIKASGHLLIFKKIDSTLRGHVGIEIEVVCDELEYGLTVFSPAFPEAGRVTIGGYQLVAGVPVDRTVTAVDPGSPVGTASICDLLAGQTSLRIESVALNTVTKGPAALTAQLTEIVHASSAITVVDAASSDDLAHILTATKEVEIETLLCGAAGLARSVADDLSARDERRIDRKIGLPVTQAPILVIAGSLNPVTRAQIQILEKTRDTTVINVNPASLLSEASATENDRAFAEAMTALSSGHDTVITFSVTPPPQPESDGAADSNSVENIVVELATCLGILTEQILGAATIGGLVLTGGETAGQAIRHLGAYGTELVERIMDGVAGSLLVGGRYENLPVIIKPGGFGESHALEQCVRRLRPLRLPTSPSSDRPILGITIGDPNGVGPEVIAKALSSPRIYEICRPLVIGHSRVIEGALHFGPVPLKAIRVEHAEQAMFEYGTIDVLNVVEMDPSELRIGEVQEIAGRLAVTAVVEATKLAMDGKIQAVVTAPLNKEAMNLAGFHYAGHTELLAELTGTDDYRLTLAFDGKLVSHVTTHVSLRQAIERLSEGGIIATIEIVGNALKRMGIPAPDIAVAGLNPHAGEGGMFGDEEINIISPALDKARSQGWNITGPLPPDTVFLRAMRGEFDGIVGMYHDQGHIPVKAIAFDRSVNVSLGLPIIRTSVDHGTAFDIAGRGIANEENLEAAIDMAVRLVGDGWSVTHKESAPSAG
ncbi:MAG: 4-hydroxythreonine-4-phosphate dehydrogenase PdxA [Candidatus Latescibacteria bacterium]|nr:4-hydroxythreonine-4-phosphate dehydrogenase PdxA [Candidatus Latescibacterota bacterium]